MLTGCSIDLNRPKYPEYVNLSLSSTFPVMLKSIICNSRLISFMLAGIHLLPEYKLTELRCFHQKHKY